MGEYLNTVFEPSIFEMMKQQGYPSIPYVNVWGQDAREGWAQFFDSPRYSSGYAALFNTFSFISEAHMPRRLHMVAILVYTITLAMALVLPLTLNT